MQNPARHFLQRLPPFFVLLWHIRGSLFLCTRVLSCRVQNGAKQFRRDMVPQGTGGANVHHLFPLPYLSSFLSPSNHASLLYLYHSPLGSHARFRCCSKNCPWTLESTFIPCLNFFHSHFTKLSITYNNPISDLVKCVQLFLRIPQFNFPLWKIITSPLFYITVPVLA